MMKKRTPTRPVWRFGGFGLEDEPRDLVVFAPVPREDGDRVAADRLPGVTGATRPTDTAGDTRPGVVGAGRRADEAGDTRPGVVGAVEADRPLTMAGDALPGVVGSDLPPGIWQNPGPNSFTKETQKSCWTQKLQSISSPQDYYSFLS